MIFDSTLGYSNPEKLPRPPLENPPFSPPLVKGGWWDFEKGGKLRTNSGLSAFACLCLPAIFLAGQRQTGHRQASSTYF
jgi:hypothetical protein